MLPWIFFKKETFVLEFATLFHIETEVVMKSRTKTIHFQYKKNEL